MNLELETTFSLDATERPGGNILRMPLEAVSPVRELVNPIAKAVLEKFHGDPCVMSHKGPLLFVSALYDSQRDLPKSGIIGYVYYKYDNKAAP